MTVTRVERLDLMLSDRPWPFAVERRAEIDADFAKRCRANPHLWNGKVLLLHRYSIADAVFHGEFLTADYASLLAWKSWAPPDAGVFNAFSAIAVVSSDGAVLLGEMGPSTANAGKIYFPCGTPDMDDVSQGQVDFEHSAARELEEETGLDTRTLDVEPGWLIVKTGILIAAIKVAHARENAATLTGHAERYIASERQAELSAIHMIRNLAEVTDKMPDFVRAFVEYFQAQRGKMGA